MSLMNGLSQGLSEMGKGLSTFAGVAGAEQMRANTQADLLGQQQSFESVLQDKKTAAAKEMAQLADSLETARQLKLQGSSQTFQSSEAEKARQGTLTNEIARLREAAALRDTEKPEAIRLLEHLGYDPKALAGNSPSLATSGASSSTDAAAPTPAAGLTNSLGASILNHALGQPPPGSDAAIRIAIANGVSSDPEWKTKPLDQQAAEVKKRLASASASLSSDALDTLADRTIAGDTTALTGLGYGEGGAANRAAAQERITQKLKAKGLGGADLAAAIASYSGEKAGARTAGTREANVGMAVTEAQLFMPLALEASKAVSRTQFPTLNSIIQAAEKGTGDENIVRLAVATNSLVNAYARAITPSGIPTEGNQTRARELLDKAWSDGQYAAAVDQLGKEMAAAKQSPLQQQNEQRSRISGRPGSPASDVAAPAAATTDPLAAARDAINRGAPRDAVIKRLRDNGIDPGGL